MPARGRHPHRRLTDLAVRHAGPGRHADGNGLYLFVRPNGARSWVQRLVIHGRRRDLGLGSYPLVSLADARHLALDNRRVARSGGDPAAVCDVAVPHVRDVAEQVIQARKVAWRNPSTERKWRRLFRDLVFPKIGDKPIDKVTLDEIKQIVAPHWRGRRSTGYVVRQHLDAVMQWAIAHGHRADNPAVQVKVLLPNISTEVAHHPSLPYQKVREAMAAVQGAEADPAIKLSLLFVVLCASRLGEVIGATWSEIDLESRVWTQPIGRNKMNRVHRVPLSRQAVELLQRMRVLNRPGRFVFLVDGSRGGSRQPAGHDYSRLLRPFGYVDEQKRPIVMHGFRSTFRVWALEVAKAPSEVAEVALAHIESETVRAYLRQEGLDLGIRRELMQSWADYVVPRL